MKAEESPVGMVVSLKHEDLSLIPRIQVCVVVAVFKSKQSQSSTQQRCNTDRAQGLRSRVFI